MMTDAALNGGPQVMEWKEGEAEPRVVFTAEVTAAAANANLEATRHHRTAFTRVGAGTAGACAALSAALARQPVRTIPGIARVSRMLLDQC